MQYHFKQYQNKIALTAPTGLATKNLVDRCEISINNFICCNSFKLIKYTFPKIIESINYTLEKSQEEIEIELEEIINERALVSDESKNQKLLSKENLLRFYEYKPKIIILDEASMITIIDFYELLKFCKKFRCRLILLGDPNQLPPIGKGQPLSDIIDSQLFDIRELTNIMRNSGSLKRAVEDLCLGNKISISNDNTLLFNDIDNISDDDSLKLFIENNKLDKEDTKFITPCNNGTFGRIELNKKLQEIYNYDGTFIDLNYSKFDTQYRIFDKIIRTKNSYDESAIYANGDMAVITDVIYEEDKDGNSYVKKLKLNMIKII